MIRTVCCDKEIHPDKSWLFVRYLFHATNILHDLHAVMFYINTFIIIDILWSWHRGTSRYLWGGKSILIVEAMFNTLIKETHKARIGAVCV